jgi:hypothetical protein
MKKILWRKQRELFIFIILFSSIKKNATKDELEAEGKKNYPT